MFGSILMLLAAMFFTLIHEWGMLACVIASYSLGYLDARAYWRN